jgi:hypothetical protein
MSTQAEATYRAAKERLSAAPNDLTALKEFSEAARAAGHRPEALDALKAAYSKRPTQELYAELRIICTYPEFQALAKPPESGAAPAKQAGTGAELLPRKPFPLLLDQVVLYPVQDGLSVFILICCSMMLGIGNIVWTLAGPLGIGAAIILAGFPCAYFWTVVTSSGMGEKRTRGWPDVTDPAEMSEAFGRWGMVSIACFAPAVFMLVYNPLFNHEPLESVHIFSAIGLGFLGVCYYPMALMLAGFTHDSWQIFNLPSALRSIVKIPGDYLICLGFFVASYVMVVLIEILLGNVGANALAQKQVPLWVVLTIFGRVIDTYLIMVQMRTVGLLYYAREKDLGWFQ